MNIDKKVTLRALPKASVIDVTPSLEGDVLIELYENPDVPFSSYTLTQQLNSNLQIASPEYTIAFARVSSVIEKHIGRLIRGKRSKSADGIFFNNLKLTLKGEQAAIQERKRRALPETVKQLLDIAELIRGRDRGASS